MPAIPGTGTPPVLMVCWRRKIRNCKIATAEERLGMSSLGTVGGAGTDEVVLVGTDEVALVGTALVKDCPILETVRLGTGVVIGTPVNMDVSDGRTVGTVEWVGVAETEEREKVIGQREVPQRVLSQRGLRGN